MQNKILSWAGLTVIAILALLDTKAQAHITETYSERTNNYDSIDSRTRGKLKEIVHTFFDEKEYKFELLNDKISYLYVNEVKIPEAQFDNYEAVIGRIRKQIAKVNYLLPVNLLIKITAVPFVLVIDDVVDFHAVTVLDFSNLICLTTISCPSETIRLYVLASVWLKSCWDIVL
jgi:hypothetical protein